MDFTAYDIIYFAGGWGAAFDLGQSEELGQKVSEAYAAGRVLGGICHGPLGLLRGRTPEGQLIVKGRHLTAVTDRQIHELGIEVTPLHPETALRQAGALFESETHPSRPTSSPTTSSPTATSSPGRTRTPGRWWRG